MTQVGEAVAVAVIDTGPCPFCESKQQSPKYESLELRNDSFKLAQYLTGTPPRYGVDNLDSIPDTHYYIKEAYWDTDDKSFVAFNAHHAIPGNASLSKCPQILKWMAGTVTFKKIWYEKKTAAKAHLVGTQQANTIAGPPDIEVEDTVILSSTGATLKHTVLRTVEDNHVTGKINYDVNRNFNGVWLPSNNAIHGWGAMSSVFKSMYSATAMAYGYQFHDAHPNYSNEVKLDLGAIDEKLVTKADDCAKGCKNSQKPPPAPDRLRATLERLSNELKNLLRLTKGKTVTGDYYTSDLANGFTPK